MIARRLRSPSGVALAACLALTVPPVSPMPSTGVDPSWVLGINLARREHLHFGSQLQYTYGPWGFLDSPVGVSRLNLVASMVFTAIAVAVAWGALWSSGRRWLSPTVSAIGAAAVVVAVLPLGGADTLLLMGVSLGCALFLASPSPQRRPWVPAGAAAAAALALQIKFSEGVILLVIAIAVAACAPHRPLRRGIEAAVAYLVVTVLAWWVGGQHFGDFLAFLRSGVQISRGYGDAMGKEYLPNVFGYLLIAALGIVVLSYLVRDVRRQPWRRGLGVAVVLLATAYLGYREGTGRNTTQNQSVYYLLLLPVAAYAIERGGRRVYRAAVLALVVVLAWNHANYVGPQADRGRWALAVELVTSSPYRHQYLADARAKARRTYQVSPRLLRAIGDAPVNVDGWEASLAWAYRLNWRPMPVFQSYVAYTAALDRTNARWLVDAPADQTVIRPVVTGIDGRNSLWDPPRYVTTELCRTRVLGADDDWLVLRRTADRCGAAVRGSTQHTGRDTAVTVPTAGPNQLVTMSFHPDGPGLVTALARTLDKPRTPLLVEADGRHFRLPRALAGGPLVMNVPGVLGWPSRFGGRTKYHQVSFSEPGSVTFSVRTVSSAP